MPNHPICTDPQDYKICDSCRRNPEHYDEIEIAGPMQRKERPTAWDGKCSSWEEIRRASNG